MTYGSGANGCLGHGNLNDVTQVGRHALTLYLIYTHFKVCVISADQDQPEHLYKLTVTETVFEPLHQIMLTSNQT